MGLAILFAIGGVLGWLSSIIQSQTDGREILIDIGAGVLGALLLGLLMSSSSLVKEISASTFFFGCIGAAGGLLVAHMVRRGIPG